MKLVLITKPTFFVEEDKIIASLFEEGLEKITTARLRYTTIII